MMASRLKSGRNLARTPRDLGFDAALKTEGPPRPLTLPYRMQECFRAGNLAYGPDFERGKPQHRASGRPSAGRRTDV